MWLAIGALSLITLGSLAFVLRSWSGSRRRTMGAMSERWLSEHKAESRE